jgi:isopentenyldiphosphate isomerase/intracellular septation protein A
MNPRMLLRALLPSLAPVLVFVAVDAMFGEVVGCVVGMAVGVGELAWSLLRTRRIDPFLAADTALLAAACALTLALQNELFFKLKPAVIEAVLAIGMAGFLVLPPSALQGYVASHLKGVSVPEASLPAMRRSLALLIGAMAVHVGLTVWAALALSTAAWGFISGALLYILFGAVVLFQLGSARLGARASAQAGGAGRRTPGAKAGPRRRAAAEALPVVDSEGKVIEVAPVDACHKGPGKMHPAVRLAITDGTGALYLQKRAADAEVDPGLWETAVTSHVTASENLETVLAREAGRQLGIALPPPGSSVESPKLMLRYRWEDARESELVFSFIMRRSQAVVPDPRVVAEGRFWRPEEIKTSLGAGVFTPRFEFELSLIDKAMAEARNRA